VLSPKFFHNASASRFPFGTGSEAISMIEWLATHNAALEESWVPLPADNLCGQLLQLLAVMAEGEVSMAPFLPSNGLGESEDNYNVVVGVKRKPEGGQEVGFVKPKIQRTQDASPGFRRERGFPGIHVCLHQASKPLGSLLQASSTKGSKTSEQTLTKIFEQANTAPVIGDCILESGIESEEVPPVDYTDSTEANTELLQSGIVKGDDISRLSVVNVVDEGIGVGHGHSSVLADCIQHFCRVSKGGEDMNGSEGFNLKPLFLEAVLDIIEDAGAEGLSISHLTESLTRIGELCSYF
jgi:general transcription factor 3C polypeptide 1